ncbi:EAL domain-containing protein [Thiofaba sp. EF100]|uniref:EAL domain-containing protein n=1 Tax=Thiofaba sp. EF100 TaxID=3121274 RepID=UPI00322180FA
MNRLLPRRLKTFLPLLMFGATLAFSLLSLLVLDFSERSRLIAELEAHLREEGARLARQAEVDLARDPARLEREIMLHAAEEGEVHTALFDPDGKVLYASQLDWVGREAAEVESMLDAARYASISAGLEPYLMRDGLRLMIWVPYAHPSAPGELSSTRRGLIHIDYDLSERVAARRTENLRDELPLLMLGLVMVVIFAFWLDRGVAAPLQALRETMGRVMGGDLNARVGRRGVFELAELTASFDRMVEWLGRETRSLREQRDFDHTLLQALPALVVVVDGEERIVLANRRVAEWLDCAPEALEQQPFSILTQPSGEPFPRLFARLRDGELHEIRGVEAPLPAADGSMRWINWSLRRLDGMVLAVGEDVTTQRAAETRLRLAQTVFDHLDETLLITDPEQRIIAVNPAFTRIMGYAEEDVLGKTPAELSSGLHDAGFYRQLWYGLNTTGQWQGEIWDRRKDGTLIPLWQTISAVRDERGRLLHYVANASDLSALKQAQERSAWFAEHDSLTGLLNRAGFLARLREHLAQAAETGQHGAVLVLNLDRFKSVNEGRGPQWGDALLIAAGERLRLHAPVGVGLARLAADEFAVLLPPGRADATAAAELALRIAEALRSALRQPLDVHEETFRVSASLGIALYPPPELEGAEPSEETLRQANLAMHVAKVEGGDRVEFFERGMGERVRVAFDLEHALARALAVGESERPFRLFLQPQMDATGALRGFEALVRWIDPQQGMISPAQFIPIAEQSGMIGVLGDWVLDRACFHLGQLSREGRALSIAVNISPRQFAASDFVARVSQSLARHGADPGLLVLEVTEGLVIDNPGRTISTMLELARLGVRFSIDDFGTGYSSFAYLKRLPIHELKIDRSFIRDLPHDGDDAAIVDTIIAMAAHLKLMVVAEGVETEAQAAFLRERGQVIAQGFLYGRPEPAEDWLGRVFAGGGGEEA